MSGADVTSYTELIAAIRLQVAALGVKYEDFDVLCGFSDGYSGKALGPTQVKRFSAESLFYAIRGAGLRLRVEVDPGQVEKMQALIKSKLIQPRQTNQARMGNEASPAGTRMMGRVFRHFAKLGGKARMSQMTKPQLRKHQQNAALAKARKDRKTRKVLQRTRERWERWERKQEAERAECVADRPVPDIIRHETAARRQRQMVLGQAKTET